MILLVLSLLSIKISIPDSQPDHNPTSASAWQENVSGIDIVFVNMRSVMKKINLLKSFVKDAKPHCLCIGETWLHDGIPDFFVTPSSYAIVRQDRDGYAGG